MPTKAAKFKLGDLVRFPRHHILGDDPPMLYMVTRKANEAGYILVKHVIDFLKHTDNMLFHEDDFDLFSSAPKT